MRSGNLEIYYLFATYSTYTKQQNRRATLRKIRLLLKCSTVLEMCGMIEPLLALTALMGSVHTPHLTS